MEYMNPSDYWMNTIPDDHYNGMTDDERFRAGCMHLLTYIIAMVLGIIVCAILSSCSTSRYVPVVEERTDTLRVIQQQRDSVWLHDSIHIVERGDTVRIDRWHTRYMERMKFDTVYKWHVEHVPQAYPVEKRVEVEKPLTWWQRLRLGAGTLFIYIIALCLLWLVFVKFRIVEF